MSEALAVIAAATERLPGRRATGTLSVSSAPTFANRWLLPRLPRFAEQYPDIQVSIDTSLRHVELPLDGIDLAIRMAREAKSNGNWIRLIEESLVPVCSPSVRAWLGSRMSDVFSEVPLIHVTSVSEDWAEWFRSAGIDPPDLRPGLRVDTIQMSFEAAAQGLGIALGRKPLIDDALVQGRLVEACGPVIPGAMSYWLVGAESTFERPEIKAIPDLVAERARGRRRSVVRRFSLTHRSLAAARAWALTPPLPRARGRPTRRRRQACARSCPRSH